MAVILLQWNMPYGRVDSAFSMKSEGGNQGMNAAFFAYDGCALWQVALLQMFLRNAGVHMDTVTVDGKDIVSDGGLYIRATVGIGEVYGEDYDLCIMAGGDVTQFVENIEVRKFIRSIKGWVGASCASVALVGASGRLCGAFTCLSHTVETYAMYLSSQDYTGDDVCVSPECRLITAKGHAHYDFMMAILDETGLTARDPHLARVACKLSKNQSI